MKNLLTVLLALGLCVSLYFNWRHCSSNGTERSVRTLNLSDSTEISITVLGGNTIKDSLPPKPGQDTMTISVKSNMLAAQTADQVGYGKVCCPIPPKDTTAGARMRCIDPSQIIGIQVRSLGMKP